jgi:hypothetical protein
MFQLTENETARMVSQNAIPSWQSSEQDIQTIFSALKKLLTPPAIKRQRIGFRRNYEKE